MKTINLKLIKGKNLGVKIKSVKELVIHRKFCKFSDFVVNENEIFCDSCFRVLLTFCPFCGSTKMEESKFYIKCPVCKAIFNKKFL